jgi:hypothetical protein
MLYREIIAVCSQIHTKHINTLCGQNVEFLNVETAGTYGNHWTLKCKVRTYIYFEIKILESRIIQYIPPPIQIPIIHF